MPIYRVEAFDESGRFACACTIRASNAQAAQTKFATLPIKAASTAELWFGDNRLAARNLVEPAREAVRQVRSASLVG